MHTLRRLLMATLVVVAGSLAVAGSASAITIGDPIPSSSPYTPQPGTYRIDAVRPDPSSPIPWALASWIGTRTTPFGEITAVCMDVGRFYAGKVGELHAGGVFRPYGENVASGGCGGAEPGQTRGGTGGGDERYAVEPAAPCVTGSTDPLCGDANLRVTAYGLGGTGIFAGWREVGSTWKRMPLSGPDNAYLVVNPAGGSNRVRLKGTLCGPLARPLLNVPPNQPVVDGCWITITLPPVF